eukprot:Gb_04744 [translate_table: standard]
MHFSISVGIGDKFWKLFDHEEGSKKDETVAPESVEDDSSKQNKNEDEQDEQEMKVDEKEGKNKEEDKLREELELHAEEDDKSVKKPKVNVEEDKVKEDEAQAEKEQAEELKFEAPRALACKKENGVDMSTLEDKSDQRKPVKPMEVASHESNEKHVDHIGWRSSDISKGCCLLKEVNSSDEASCRRKIIRRIFMWEKIPHHMSEEPSFSCQRKPSCCGFFIDVVRLMAFSTRRRKVLRRKGAEYQLSEGGSNIGGPDHVEQALISEDLNNLLVRSITHIIIPKHLVDYG